MKEYVHCDRVNDCEKFPDGCSPLCDDFNGYACMGDDDKMDMSSHREISEEQLIKNDRKYEDATRM